jgi:glycosyltransferase involved in cell wall biosynthesis
MVTNAASSEPNVIPPRSFERLAIIFCAKNCEKTIGNAISSVKGMRFANIATVTIVVDGFSTDSTIKVAKEAGTTSVIEQPERKFPGKGIAMKAGLAEAAKMKADIALFLDADIKNLTSDWVTKLVQPVLQRGYDMTRGYYDRRPRDAAVTKLVAKPMISVFFPELANIEQPLSGEVCATMAVWNDLLEKEATRNNGGSDRIIPDGWGIDVWFLIEAMLSGRKIKEVYLGRKEHTSYDEYAEDVAVLSKMSEQVLFTIIKEAVKHGRFDLHKTVNA